MSVTEKKVAIQKVFLSLWFFKSEIHGPIVLEMQPPEEAAGGECCEGTVCQSHSKAFRQRVNRAEREAPAREHGHLFLNDSVTALGTGYEMLMQAALFDI